jgi:hypothetical protein
MATALLVPQGVLQSRGQSVWQRRRDKLTFTILKLMGTCVPVPLLTAEGVR